MQSGVNGFGGPVVVVAAGTVVLLAPGTVAWLLTSVMVDSDVLPVSTGAAFGDELLQALRLSNDAMPNATSGTDFMVRCLS